MIVLLGRGQSAFVVLSAIVARGPCSAGRGTLSRRLFHTLLIAFQISPDALFGIADGIRQFDFCEIMSVKTLNVTFVGAGDGFLRLHNFQIIRHAGSKSVLRLRDGLLGQFHRTACDLYLLGGSVQIQQSCADFIIDPAAKIAQLGASLLQLGVSFENVGMHPVAGENGDVDAPIHLPGPV